MEQLRVPIKQTVFKNLLKGKIFQIEIEIERTKVNVHQFSGVEFTNIDNKILQKITFSTNEITFLDEHTNTATMRLERLLGRQNC